MRDDGEAAGGGESLAGSTGSTNEEPADELATRGFRRRFIGFLRRDAFRDAQTTAVKILPEKCRGKTQKMQHLSRFFTLHVFSCVGARRSALALHYRNLTFFFFFSSPIYFAHACRLTCFCVSFRYPQSRSNMHERLLARMRFSYYRTCSCFCFGVGHTNISG